MIALKFAAKWLLFFALSVKIVSAVLLLPVYFLANAFALSGVTAWILTVLIVTFSINWAWTLFQSNMLAKAHAHRDINVRR